MPFDAKAFRRELRHRSGAGVDRIDAVAAVAVEVVVVVAPGRLSVRGVCFIHSFIPSDLAGQRHALNDALLQQILQAAIDRRQVQSWNGLLRRGADLGRGQRSATGDERAEDGVTLLGVSFHMAFYCFCVCVCNRARSSTSCRIVDRDPSATTQH